MGHDDVGLVSWFGPVAGVVGGVEVVAAGVAVVDGLPGDAF